MKQVWFTAAIVALTVGVSNAAVYTIDPAHSSVSFKIKHVVGKVIGHFDKFTGEFTYDASKTDSWSATANIDPATINTGIDKRDAHLKTPDFFDVQKFPTMIFVGKNVTDVNGTSAKLHGFLTMHGIVKPVDLDLTINGVAQDPMGKGTRAGASAVGHINRNDFGIGPATGPMAGMIGSDVEIDIEVEGVTK